MLPCEGSSRSVDHQVPLVDREDARLVLLGDVVGQLLVEPADALGGVEEQQDDVGPADRPLGAVDRVEVQALADLGLALHAGGVDGQERHAVELEMDVDRVAGGAGPLRDDHPLGVRQGVDEGRLAGVGPADHGDLHLGVGRLARRRPAGSISLDQLQQLLLVAVLLRRDGDRLAPAELVELAAAIVESRDSPPCSSPG